MQDQLLSATVLAGGGGEKGAASLDMMAAAAHTCNPDALHYIHPQPQLTPSNRSLENTDQNLQAD